MIAFLKGEIKNLNLNSIIIDVNGVGYYILISSSTHNFILNSDSKTHQILTYHHITDSSQSLFGFIKEEEKEIFKLLISVSGIGPKTGIQMLSSISAVELRDRIIAGEVEPLTSIQGIGAKTAKRIIIELREKFTNLSNNDVPIEGKIFEKDNSKDAFDALVVLGYNKREIQDSINNIMSKNSNIETSELIKEVLNQIGGK
tara:strand:+ start:162 stop:764 length:603 start_codon:yes stop_codon:yes gene_type:complete